MCSRLGIRQAFSQAHHHQANGRAEVAGRVLQSLLQKLHAQSNINWVEALPRALRIHHDSVDPVLGLSPYQAVFGRHRSLAQLPWSRETRCEDARQFFDRMAEVDAKVSTLREQWHYHIEAKVNSRRRSRPPYEVGDYVFLMKPERVGGNKISTWWLGPYEVSARVGQNSYQIKIPREGTIDAHATQLKLCHWDDPATSGTEMRVPPPPEIQTTT